MTKKEFASYIDHTLLNTEAGVKDIIKLCQEAVSYEFTSVCVNPVYVPLAASELENTNVKVCTVVGFPLGAVPSENKVCETVLAIQNGAEEIDMVINLNSAFDKDFNYITNDIKAVVDAAKAEGSKFGKKIIVKVILETCYLDDETIIQCCLCAKQANADFVKTSTGFANPKGTDGNLLPNGASEYHIKLMRKVVGAGFGVKASGGIRSTKMALAMIDAGADRIGTSSGINILDNFIED
jgi:deoxyribose-phosphate aldolase